MARERPPLHLLKKGSPGPESPAPSAPAPGWALATVAAVTLFCCAILLIPERGSVPRIQVGDTPLTDVVAPRDLSIPDRAATRAARNLAMARVPMVYDLSPADTDRLEAKIRDTFASVRILRHTGTGTTAQVEELLRTRLGVLPPTNLKPLTPARFTRRMETELVDTLRLVLERGILLGRDDVPGGPNFEVLVRTVGTVRESYVKLRNLPTLEDARRQIAQAALQAYPQSAEARAVLTFLGNGLVFANLTENNRETQLRKEAAADRVKPLFFAVKKGEVIVPSGAQVLRAHADILAAYQPFGARTFLQRIIGLGLLCAMVFYVFYLDLKGVRSRVVKELPRAMLTGIIMVGSLALCRLTLFLLSAFTTRFETVGMLTIPYAMPVTLGAMLMALLLSVRIALVFAMTGSILIGLMVPEAPLFTLYGFVTSLVAVFAVEGCQRRSQLARAGIWVGLVSAGVVAGIDLQQGIMNDPARLYDMAFAFSGGLLAAVLVSAVLPVLESTFNVPTNIRLLELSDLNHPLLRKLLEQAPGTYHHSMIMSNMAEQAAKAIDENALLARVGCYYHDVGKLLKPAYYIENQWGSEHNLHDKLTPSMSRLVLVAHVKDGVELARRHALPQEVIDMIPQHHGTRLINYFYVKERNRQAPDEPPPDEQNFRYPGPRPQTKVAGIIMLADTVEASSRVLDEPSPARIAALVDKLVNTIYLDQQLDQCDLTLRDLRKIAVAFTKALTGTFHHRIQYPGMLLPHPKADAGPTDQSTTPLSR